MIPNIHPVALSAKSHLPALLLVLRIMAPARETTPRLEGRAGLTVAPHTQAHTDSLTMEPSPSHLSPITGSHTAETMGTSLAEATAEERTLTSSFRCEIPRTQGKQGLSKTTKCSG